jgi:hypothetical protein
MKTPREILFARHQAAEPRLDALRQTFVAAVCDRRHSTVNSEERRSQTAATMAWCLHCLTTPWRELILPSRRIWTGLTATWILVFIINVAQRDPVSSVTGQPVHSAPVMMSWQTQQRLINELLADRSAPPEADRPRNVTPRPRTEKCGMATV